MTVHSFTLILDLDYATEGQMDAIAVTSDELMLSSSDGVAFVSVDRPADTLDSALRSAIADVERACPASTSCEPRSTAPTWMHRPPRSRWTRLDPFLDPTRRRTADSREHW